MYLLTHLIIFSNIFCSNFQIEIMDMQYLNKTRSIVAKMNDFYNWSHSLSGMSIYKNNFNFNL